jgi:hypothetical protein
VSLLLAQPAVANRAGNEDIGGGDAIYSTSTGQCYVLDYEIALRGGTVTRDELDAGLGAATQDDPTAMVQRVIDRMDRLDHDFAKQFADMISLIGDRLVRDPPAIVPSQDLSRYGVVLGSGESVVRVFEWRLHVVEGGELTFDSDPVWRVNGSMLRHMDPVNTTGLLIHETIYVLHARDRHANGRGDLDLEAVHEFVAKVSTPWLDTATPAQFKRFMKRLGLFGPRES